MNKNLVFQQLFDLSTSTYTYLLADAKTKEAVLIDTVLENVDRDLKLIDELGLELIYVLDTHIHADHVTGSGKIRSNRDVKTAVPKKANVPCADFNVSEGDEIKFGQFKIEVLETPGHTDASVSFVCEGMVFSGDALLIRGSGRTDFQSGSASQLYDSITKKLFTLPGLTILYPAHDYKGFTSSTIDAEIKNNPRAGGGKTKDQFVQIMSELKLAYPKKIDEALPANLVCGNIDHKESDVQFTALAAHEVKNQLDHMLVVDVRDPDEFFGELGHIHGSHQITLGSPLKEFLQGYDRNESLLFVCKTGRRSEQAARMAIEMGYPKVSHLLGGIQSWNEQQLPIKK